MNHIREIAEKIKNNSSLTAHGELESPIEERLYNHIEKYKKQDVKLIPQYPVSTISGNFRIDFVLKNKERVIGIECDGEEFHTKDKDDWYDEWRDTLIMVQSDVKNIYRVKGKDIYQNINDLIYFIGKNEPEFFNSSSEKLKPLIHEGTLKDNRFDVIDRKGIIYEISDENGNEIQRLIQIKKRNLGNDFDPFYRKYLLYSMIYPNVKIPELIEIFCKKGFSEEELIEKYNEKYPENKIEK
ncbi:MAG: hypothetical protein R2830_15265 [Saprospiraceae bacterium]